MTPQVPRPALSVWMRLIIGLYTAALLSYIGMGAFSRMMADDFCTVATGRRLSPIAATQDWYEHWSGLYSNFFIKSALGPFEPAVHPFITGAFILGLFGILWLVLRDVLRKYAVLHVGWIAFLLSGALTFGLIDGAISRQPIFWSGALIPYSLPLIPLIAALGLAFRLIFVPSSRGVQITLTILFALLVFFIAGFSEVYAAYEGALWGILLLAGTLALAREKRGQLWALMGLGMGVTLVAIWVILRSPGNAIRRAAQDQTLLIQNPLELVGPVFDFSISIFVLEPYGIVHFLLIFLATMGVWIWAVSNGQDAAALPAPKRLRPAFLLSFLAAFVLVMVATTPPMYGAGLVTARTLMPIRFTQIMLFGLWGYWAAVGLTRTNTLKRLQLSRSYRLVKWEVLAALVIIPTIVLIRHAGLVGGFATYARQWDERDAAIIEARERGETTVLIGPMDYNLEDYLSLDSLTKASTTADVVWVYNCLKGYYGMDFELSTPTEIMNPDKEES